MELRTTSSMGTGKGGYEWEVRILTGGPTSTSAMPCHQSNTRTRTARSLTQGGGSAEPSHPATSQDTPRQRQRHATPSFPIAWTGLELEARLLTLISPCTANSGHGLLLCNCRW